MYFVFEDLVNTVVVENEVGRVWGLLAHSCAVARDF